MKKKRILPWLFGMNCYISSFTFGGGYVVIPMIRKAFVERKGLFTEEELLDMAAVAQSSPGAIAINLSALVGNRVAGALGGAVAALGAVTPPLIILSLVAVTYHAFVDNRMIAAAMKGMEAAVAALMLDLVVDMSRAVFKRRSFFLSFLIPASFIAAFVLQCNVGLVLVGCAGVAALKALCGGGRNEEKADV